VTVLALGLALGGSVLLARVDAPSLAEPAAAAGTDPPDAVTGDIGALHVDSVRLHGTVDPNGSPTRYHFEYGHKPGWRHSTKVRDVGDGGTPVAVSVRLTGLRPGRKYHYRLVATNPNGTSHGDAKTFRTLDPRIRGPFRMRVVVRAGGAPFHQHKGKAVHRLYRFRPHCGDVKCGSLTLRRRAQRGRFSSNLDRKAPGVYGGVERFRGGWCDDGLRFKSRARIHARVGRIVGDNARRVTGRFRVRVHGCVHGAESARFAGTRRR